jgi:hypothetical protein
MMKATSVTIFPSAQTATMKIVDSALTSKKKMLRLKKMIKFMMMLTTKSKE